MSPNELIFDPEQYSRVPARELLEAASRGYVAVDHRLLHALLDRADHSDLVRFASEDHGESPVELDEVLLDIFRYLRTPEAIPFYAELIRRNPADVPDELVETLVELGAVAVEPLLALLDQLEEPGDVPFILSALGVRDARILKALERGLDNDALNAALSLEMYGDPAATPAIQAALARVPETDASQRQFIQDAIDSLAKGVKRSAGAPAQFDIWSKYPEEDSPAFHVLSDAEKLAMMERGSAPMRAGAAASYGGSEPALAVRARILDLAKNDPEPSVRAACWEALAEISGEPEVRRAMLHVLGDPDASLEEKAGAAIALADYSDNTQVFRAIEASYENASTRAQALKAMARSLDRRFSAYPPRHLGDSDPEIKRHAIWGIGYLKLSADAPRLEAIFNDEEFRQDALFAYALASPGETSPGRVTALVNKIDRLAGGLNPDETELVQIALDQRLLMAGHKPVFFADEEQDQPEPKPATIAKVGRNDACPCGSGKKFKNCCGG